MGAEGRIKWFVTSVELLHLPPVVEQPHEGVTLVVERCP